MLGMSRVVSMAVVEGLSAEQIAARLEAELGEETTSDSPSGEEAGGGPGLPAVGIQILGVPPGIFADKAAPYRAQQAQTDAAGEEDICYLGEAVVELFVSLTGIHFDRDGGGGTCGIGISGPIDRASG
jgi:hypothetical protein